MFLRNRIRCLKMPRSIKRYWLKCFTMFLILSIIIIWLLHRMYGKELHRLHTLRRIEMEKIKGAGLINMTNTTDTWRKPGVENAAIFSAYLDARPEVVLEEVFNAESRNLWALVRIIAILPVSYDNSELTCYYKFSVLPGDDRILISEAPAIAVRIVASTENFGMANSAAFVLCKLITSEDGRLPKQISFSSERRNYPWGLHKIDFVDIHYTNRTNTEDQNRFMAVCVPSLHHNYKKYANLIEFVEFYRTMGVEHFTFYNTSISEEVSRVLAYYKDQNLATVIQWQLPKFYKFEQNLRYNGIFAAMNDCLYRNTMIEGFKYVVNVDLDEFIVPRQHDNFQQMMIHLDRDSDVNKNAVFILRNMFFYLPLNDDHIPQSPPDIPKLLLHTKTMRWVRINPSHDRSKYIIRGQEVIEMGNHQVWHTRKASIQTSYKETVVDPEIAAMHHYRYCEVNELVCWLRNTVRDITAHRFTLVLGSNVKTILKTLSLL